MILTPHSFSSVPPARGFWVGARNPVRGAGATHRSLLSQQHLHPHPQNSEIKIFSAKKWQNKNGTPTLRNQQVILSNHVAELYGVETREINQAVKNNPDKFPEGYIIELNKKEKEEVIKNFDNLGNLLYSPAPPKAFTEKGLYMLATIQIPCG